MDGAKSPGPDGFSMLFYQECCDTIKEDLMKVKGEFFERGALNKSMSSTFIVLISKKDEAREMRDFHPINLITSLYKIISKVFSLRLKENMGSVVGATQSAFIKWRQITDSILIANECVDMRRRAKWNGVVCKLDLEKAYDKVD